MTNVNMAQPGYQEGGEPRWWWKVALHLDEAQLALANAMAHNLDDQRPVFALQDLLREGQILLLEIFRAKGLLPAASNGSIVPAPPAVVVPVPEGAAPAAHGMVPVFDDEPPPAAPASAAQEAAAYEAAVGDPAPPPVPVQP
jgi:hypothetical protein